MAVEKEKKSKRNAREEEFEKSAAEKREERTRELWDKLRRHVRNMRFKLQFINKYDY